MPGTTAKPVSASFDYDVLLSHGVKDKAVVRPLAERLRKDRVKVWFDEWMLKPGNSIPAKIEKRLERLRVLMLRMSANAFGSDWAQLDSGTSRYPQHTERCFPCSSMEYARNSPPISNSARWRAYDSKE